MACAHVTEYSVEGSEVNIRLMIHMNISQSPWIEASLMDEGSNLHLYPEVDQRGHQGIHP